MHSNQSISVYNACRPMKQRYKMCHYNVADGLYISNVASSSNVWALSMDAGTVFNAQEWIIEQGENNYSFILFLLLLELPGLLFFMTYLFFFRQRSIISFDTRTKPLDQVMLDGECVSSTNNKRLSASYVSTSALYRGYPTKFAIFHYFFLLWFDDKPEYP